MNILIPQTALDASRLRATSRWHRTQAAIAKRRKAQRDTQRHLAIAKQIDKVVRAAACTH